MFYIIGKYIFIFYIKYIIYKIYFYLHVILYILYYKYNITIIIIIESLISPIIADIIEANISI